MVASRCACVVRNHLPVARSSGDEVVPLASDTPAAADGSSSVDNSASRKPKTKKVKKKVKKADEAAEESLAAAKQDEIDRVRNARKQRDYASASYGEVRPRSPSDIAKSTPPKGTKPQIAPHETE